MILALRLILLAFAMLACSEEQQRGRRSLVAAGDEPVSMPSPEDDVQDPEDDPSTSEFLIQIKNEISIEPGKGGTAELGGARAIFGDNTAKEKLDVKLSEGIAQEVADQTPLLTTSQVGTSFGFGCNHR